MVQNIDILKISYDKIYITDINIKTLNNNVLIFF